MSGQVFRERLKSIVANAGGQVKFAAACGLKQTSISDYICGHTTPTAKNAIKIARAAGVTVEWLMGEDDLAAPVARAIPEPVSYQRQCSCGCGAFVLEAYRRGRAA